MTNKYRSLEHIIQDVMLKETVGILGTDRFQGNSYASGRNKSQQAQAQPYGNFEAEDNNLGSGGIKLPDKKMTVPVTPSTKDVSKPSKKISLVPDQGDATSPGKLASDGAAQEGGKKPKRVKEDTDTNIDLIKKGSTNNLLNKGPLTKYTNPQDAENTAQASSQPKPQLSFQTPDLSGGGGKGEDEIQTPKLNGKGDGKADARAKSKPGATAKNVSKPTSDKVTKTPGGAPDPFAPQSVLDKAEKAANELLGIPSAKAQAVAIPPSAGAAAGAAAPPAASGGAAKGKTGGAHADQQISDYSKRFLDAILGKPMTKYDNPDLPNDKGVTKGKIAGAQLHQKPIEKYTNPPAAAGTNVDKDPNKDYPAEKLAPHKFTDQKQAVPPVAAGGGMAGNTPKGTASPSMENPSAPSKGSQPVDVVGQEVGKQAKFTSAADYKPAGAQAVGVPPAVDHDNLPLSRASKTVPMLRNPPLPTVSLPPAASAAIPKTDEKAHPAPGLPIPHQGAKAPANDNTVPSTKPGTVPQQGADTKAPSAPKQGADTKAPAAADQGADTKAPAAADAKAEPGEFSKWKKSWDALRGKETQAERDEYNRQRDQQDKNSKKFPWLAGLGLGAAGLALLKYLAGSGRIGGAGGGSDKKSGAFIYGKQGQISGTPTRQKGGGSVKEETEGTKARRAVELVGRRTGTNKKKSSLGRQSAIKTRIIDETRHLQIMREAIKEKQEKEKKLKPGAHKTPIDTHPKLSPEPTDQLRQ